MFMDPSKSKSIVLRTIQLALTPVYIMAVIEYSGIFPLDSEKFTDSDFMLSCFSERTIPSTPNLESTINSENISNFAQ